MATYVITNEHKQVLAISEKPKDALYEFSKSNRSEAYIDVIDNGVKHTYNIKIDPKK